MKSSLSRLAAMATLSAVVALTGCGKPEESTPAATPAAPSVTAPATKPAAQPVAKDADDKVLQAFSSADAGTLASVQQVVASMRSQDYADAVPLLNNLLGGAKLTNEQQSLLKDLLAQAQQQLATAKTGEAAGELQKSLPFGK